MKKLVSTILFVFVLVTVLTPSAFALSEPPSTIFEACNEAGDAFSYPTFTAGQNPATVNVGFRLATGGLSGTVNQAKIDIITSTNLDIFPFDPVLSSYEKTITANSQNVFVYPFSMRVRGDASTGFYSIRFKITYDGSVEYVDVNMLINAVGGGGDVSNIPKVIISSFSTNPAEVVAGEEFILNVTFKNTSGSLAATNIKAQLSSADGTFTPVSGSTTIFIDSLAPNGSAAKSIRLKVKADAAPGSYSASFALNFDVAGVKDPIVDTEVLSIPVKQVPRAQVSKMQISPTEVFLGREVNVMTSVNNTGKSTLYNVNVTFKDPNGALGESEQFIGNVAAGAAGAVDVYIPTVSVGEANLTMLVTYEDENGKSYSHEETATVYVMEPGTIIDPGPEPEPEKSGGIGIGGILLIVLALLGIGAAVFFILRKRKRDEQSKEDDQRMIEELEKEYLDEEDAEAADDEQSKGDESATREIGLPEDDKK